MLETALNANRFKEEFLETTDWLVVANKFYIKNDFEAICKNQLPDNFPVLRYSGKFMRHRLP
jgi:hypothetical protein